MSILIKGMEMPSYCDDCWALDEYGDYPVCQITEEQRGYNFRTREKRMDKCPLVPVPTPHGRLIDVKALERMDFSNWIMQGDVGYVPFMEVSAVIFNAPTVIEAEEGEE